MLNHAEGEFRQNPRSIEQRLKEQGNFFIGSDIRAAQDYIIPPTLSLEDGSKEIAIDCYLDSHGLPPIDLQDEEVLDFLSFCGISTRSRGAQLGLMALLPHQLGSVDPIKDQYFQTITRERTYYNNGLLYLPLYIINLGNRSLIVKQGDGLASLYSEIGAEELQGADLSEAIGNGINIAGNFGESWVLADDNLTLLDPDQTGQARLIALRLSRQRYKVTTGPDVAMFRDDLRDYRGYLQENEIVVPIHKGDYPKFWIGETVSPIEIREGYNGVLNIAKIGQGYALQTLSSNIKGGATNMWPIRVEIVTENEQYVDTALGYDDEENLVPIDYEKDLMYIFMSLYRDK